MTSAGKLGTGRRLALLIASIAGVLVLTGGTALAATVTCRVGVYCLGTKEADTIEGTANKDAIYARGGGDNITGDASANALFAGTGADTVFGGEGDVYISVVDKFTGDTVHCGAGEDTVGYDVYLNSTAYSDVVHSDCEHRLPRHSY
jgi:Ca2+-binding RTX toxin-like protein